MERRLHPSTLKRTDMTQDNPNTQNNAQMHTNSGIDNGSYTNPQTNAQANPANNSASKNKRKRGAAFYIAIVIAVLAIVAACVFGYFWWSDQQPSTRDTNALIGQIEGKSEEEIRAELDRKVEEGMFNISIASETEFKDGASEGPLRIENVPGNRYLMQVDITRDDTGEVIYKSGIIEPNHHIQNDTLDVDLPAGTYDCTALFHALDPETEEEIGQAGAKVNIKVLN